MSFGISIGYGQQPLGHGSPDQPEPYQSGHQSSPIVQRLRCQEFHRQDWVKFVENGLICYRKSTLGIDDTTVLLVSLQKSTTLDAVIGGYVVSSKIAAGPTQRQPGHNPGIYIDYDGWVGCGMHHADLYINTFSPTKNAVLRLPMNADEIGLEALKGRILDFATRTKRAYPNIGDVYVWFDVISASSGHIPCDLCQLHQQRCNDTTPCHMCIMSGRECRRSGGQNTNDVPTTNKAIMDAMQTENHRLSEALKRKQAENDAISKVLNQTTALLNEAGMENHRLAEVLKERDKLIATLSEAPKEKEDDIKQRLQSCAGQSLADPSSSASLIQGSDHGLDDTGVATLSAEEILSGSEGQYDWMLKD